MEEQSSRPLLFCLSCTRNYGWVTKAFLEINSRWADYVIIVDQMSTDGTREMCAQYPNVILIDDPDLNYKEGTRAQMAIDRARQFPGDKILIALDIDEIMPANFQQTDDWQTIIHSPKGSMFFLPWANLLPDKIHAFGFEKAESQFRFFHDDGISTRLEGEELHTTLLPYKIGGRENYLCGFPILHFGYYFPAWQNAKYIYYQMLDLEQHRSKSLFAICRTYTSIWTLERNLNNQPQIEIKKEWLYDDVNIFDLVDTVSRPAIYDYIQELFKKNGTKKYAWLNIWDGELQTYLPTPDPRKWYHKLLHFYVLRTTPFLHSRIIHLIDKALRFITRWR